MFTQILKSDPQTEKDKEKINTILDSKNLKQSSDLMG